MLSKQSPSWSRSRSMALVLGLIIILPVALTGCGDDTGMPVDDGPVCTVGTANCECATGDICAAGLTCIDGICEPPTCVVGERDCACDQDNICGLDIDGAQLFCDVNVCVRPTCEGEAGCACDASNDCDTGLECTDSDGSGHCAPPGCGAADLGSHDCECYPNRTCLEAADACVDGLCVTPPCAAGDDGCACLADFGCNEPDSMCTADEVCGRIPDCTPGSIGCTCGAGDTCAAPGAYCDAEGRCQLSGLPEGSEGGACREGGQCDTASDGSGLICDGGICVSPNCPRGDTGCTCGAGASCTASDNTCRGGFCRPPCIEGDEFCECSVGDTCNAPDLICRDGTMCVDRAGYSGGVCLGSARCYRGLRCEGDDLCHPCILGSQGCGCSDAGDCSAPLQCMAGLCMDPAGLAELPPEDPQCYTPCTGDLARPDGTIEVCPSDGLMPGCYHGTSCMDGQCVREGGAPRSCTFDHECPNHQACLSGLCQSNCELNQDCVAGAQCFQRVCRLPCSSNGPACPGGTFCSTADAETGYCMPLDIPDDLPDAGAPGRFAVDSQTIRLSNTNIIDSIRLTNLAPTPTRFTVRKLWHRAYDRDGSFVEVRPDLDELEDCASSDCPLWWLAIGEGDERDLVSDFEVVVPSDGDAVISVGPADAASFSRWEGALEVSHRQYGNVNILLSYAARPDGRWSGSIYYFGNFKDEGIDDWVDSNFDESEIVGIKNAFVRAWANFRDGRLGLRNMEAIIISSRSESWRSPVLQERCGDGQICVPFDNHSGFIPYTSDPTGVPVPTGLVELPFAAHIRPAGDDELEENCEGEDECHLYSGRIDSTTALQYAGDPTIRLGFDTDPESCSASGAGGCLLYISDLDAEIVVGGRYTRSLQDPFCEATPGFEPVGVPWLLPGFIGGSTPDPDTGEPLTYDCRSGLFPFTDGSEEAVAQNLALAASNPIADGRPRRRRLDLIDGAVINSDTMIILFRERTAAFLPSFVEGEPPSDLLAYGFMVLEREGANLNDEDYEGQTIPEIEDDDSRLGVAQCSEALLDEIGYDLTAANANSIASRIINGRAPDSLIPAELAIDPDWEGETEEVHYLCEDTGLFDQGPDGADDPVPCPVGSRVIYFTTRPDFQDDIDAMDCQDDADYELLVNELGDGEWVLDVRVFEAGTCFEELNSWLPTRRYGVRPDPIWRCAEDDEVYCSDDRDDLRSGKVFYRQDDSNLTVFRPLWTEVEDAFRYRTRFRNREGQSVGFVPELCVPNSGAVPYCYDPVGIELVQERVDCAIEVYHVFSDVLSESVRGELRTYLQDNFSISTTENQYGEPISRYGFEHLNAELLIMLGDDAYADSLGSRFDLAGSNLASFEGSRFEPGGINLSGAAGFEMLRLYQAVQYYQMTVDRFFVLSPDIAQSISLGSHSYITQETVTTWFDRLVRASVQKARAYGEIATRYQNLNRPDLARRVIERAYTAAYLESIVLMDMIRRVVQVTLPEDLSQILSQIERGQRVYRASLSDMQGLYQSIGDGLNYFGFAPDYVPFPALEANIARDNAFEVALFRARTRLQIAQEAEQVAIASTRSFDTDQASFQNELTRLRTTYEAQLSELCGTFQANDGSGLRVFPAIPRYAYLDERAELFGNPCGLMGTGAIHQALGQIEIALNNIQRVRAAIERVLEEAQIEEDRWNLACDEINTFAQTEWERVGTINSVEEIITRNRTIISGLDRTFQTITAAAQTPGGLLFNLGLGALQGTALGFEISIAVQENRLRDLNRNLGKFRTQFQCELVEVDGKARVATILLQLAELELDALRSQYELEQVISELTQRRNQSVRLIAELEEMEQLAINIEAARNNPNIRIYRNDAIINADITFFSALRETYMATRVMEYYTSQSYGPLNELFLIRMVTAGDYNLQRYLIELEDEFRQFEDAYGLPDLRLLRLSLRDHILDIPRLNSFGEALSESERVDLFRERLRDPDLLDRNGYISIPFNTRQGQLSPLTRNHKLRYIEAEIIGSDVGDPIGRVYLRMAGTASVAALNDDTQFYAFPERTAVVNTIMNGNRIYVPEIYRSSRLFDRPVLNTRWELIINPLDEEVNEDINLDSLSDLRVYLYYTDFSTDF